MGVRSKEENITASRQEEKVLAGKNKGFQQIRDRNPEPPVGPIVRKSVQQRIAVTTLLVEEEPSGGAESQIALANKVSVGDYGRDGLAD